MKIKKRAEERFDYDFSGWATKANIKCSDGRIIDSNAFKHNDGKIVPLVWNHDHSNGDNVVGKAMLCHTDEGVYTYAQFNTTQRGKNAKEQIKHGDITNLSIYANKLHEIGNLVKDGDIKEVSLVIAGANPGACIDHVVVHGDNSDDISAEIYTDEEILVNEDGSYLSISHSDIEEENQNGIEAVLDTLTDKQIDALYTIVNRLSSLEHNDEDDDETVNEALEELKEGLNEEQSNAVCEILDRFVEDDDTEEEDDEDVDDDDELVVSIVLKKPRINELKFSKSLHDIDDDESGSVTYKGDRYNYVDSADVEFYKYCDDSRKEKLYYWDFKQGNHMITVEKWSGEKAGTDYYYSQILKPSSITVYSTKGESNGN